MRRPPYIVSTDLFLVHRRWMRAIALCLAAGLATFGQPMAAFASTGSQKDFATAEEAAGALAAALHRDDQRELLRILGPSGKRLVHSGDRVADREARTRFVSAYEAAHRVEIDANGVVTLIVGPQDWPLPIPVVEEGGRWHFDAASSAQKIIDRRVGHNELNVIEVCREYVLAQREYATEDRLGDGLREYAQKFRSSPGRRDGLYWEAVVSEEQSPLGPLVASARAEGYTAKDPHKGTEPYHGYFFRILTSQGSHAPGGQKDYIVSGHMTGGFALVAFPARWGDSGVMTFIVNQSGIVFQKNLGPNTARLARDITQYDPDLSWLAP